MNTKGSQKAVFESNGYMRGGSGGGQSSGWIFTGLFSLAGLVAVYWIVNAN